MFNWFNRDSVEFVTHFLRADPRRTAIMTTLLIFSGLAEGVGFFTLLPMLEYAAGSAGGDPSPVTVALTDILQGVGIEPTLAVMLLLIVVAMVLKGGFLWLAMKQVGYTVAQIATDLRLRLIRALMKAEWRHFVSQPAGHFATAISSEAHRASSAYREACTALAGIIRIGVYVAVAVYISWEVAVVALLVGGGIIVVLRQFVQMSREAGERQTEVMKSLIRRLTEALPGIKPIKAMAKEKYLLPMLERETEGFNEAQQSQVLAAESLKAFHEPIVVVVIAAGLYGVITWGNESFAAVLVLALIFYRLIGSINQLQLRYQTMTVGESAFHSIRDHIESAEAREEEAGEGRPSPKLSEALVFEDVCFAYEEEDVLKDVSFRVPAGDFVSLQGPSGAGKTTLVDLIVGLHRPTRGRILVDGVDLQDVDMAAWRSGIGYVPQDMLLFHASIYDNVTLGNDDIPREDVRRALEAADAWEFVSQLPGGMDRVVGERGSMLSGGQRQRIAIARALVEGPRLLVLDEATTALDPETEDEICQTLRRLRGEVTILSVSHQTAMRKVADHVYEVAGGRVHELDRVAGDVATGPAG